MLKKPIYIVSNLGISYYGDAQINIALKTDLIIAWHLNGISFKVKGMEKRVILKDKQNSAWLQDIGNEEIRIPWEDFPACNLELCQMNGESFASLNISYTDDVRQWNNYKDNIHDERGIFLVEQADFVADYMAGKEPERLWETTKKRLEELEGLHDNGKMTHDEYESFLAEIHEIKYRIAVENLGSESRPLQLKAGFHDFIRLYLDKK